MKRHVTTIPIRKPDKYTWFRVHPSETYQLVGAAVINDKQAGDVFLVDADIQGELATYVSSVVLYVVITPQGTLSVWIVRLPDSDGRLDDWNRSALEAAALAATTWTKIASNRQLGAYDVFTAPGVLGEPQWPDLTLEQIVATAFRGKVISSLDHLAVRRLRGEI